MVVSNYSIGEVKSEILTDIQINISHLAVGDNDTTPDVTDTTLGNQTFIDNLFDESIVGDIYMAVIFIDTAENNGNNIKEMGSFDTSIGGAMYNHALTNVIAKDSSTEVFVELNINISVINI